MLPPVKKHRVERRIVSKVLAVIRDILERGRREGGWVGASKMCY